VGTADGFDRISLITAFTGVIPRLLSMCIPPLRERGLSGEALTSPSG
jgi:hypothetical protein